VTRVSHSTGAVLGACLLLTGCGREAPQPEPPPEVVIPFTLTAHNNIVVKAVLNDADAFDLMLHTAASDVSLTEDAVRKSTTVTFTNAADVKSWGGTNGTRFSTGHRLQVGDLRRYGVKVWEVKYSGVGTDGKFGLDLFPGRVVEIDFDRQQLAVYDRLPSKAAGYQRLKVESENGELFVAASCEIDGTAHPHRFLLHTGYSGGLLLDDEFVTRTGIDGKLKVNDESSLKDSFGNTIRVKNVSLPTLVLGDMRLPNVPTGFFSGAVGMQKMSVLGGAVLKRFNILLDPANGSLYLRPREL
jgi:hypothetical protein